MGSILWNDTPATPALNQRLNTTQSLEQIIILHLYKEINQNISAINNYIITNGKVGLSIVSQLCSHNNI